jgi:hypothetical protein
MMRVVYILLDGMPQGTFTKENQPRQRVVLDRAYPSFGVGVQVGASRRQRDSLHSRRFDGLMKRGVELAVSIVNEGLSLREEAPGAHGHVPRDLDHPALVGMRCRAHHMDLPATQMDEVEDITGDEPVSGLHLSREKVRGHQYIHIRADLLFPCRALLAFGSGWDPMAFQEIAHGLVTDGVSKIGQGTDNTIVPPGPILLGQAHH